MSRPGPSRGPIVVVNDSDDEPRSKPAPKPKPRDLYELSDDDEPGQAKPYSSASKVPPPPRIVTSSGFKTPQKQRDKDDDDDGEISPAWKAYLKSRELEGQQLGIPPRGQQPQKQQMKLDAFTVSRPVSGSGSNAGPSRPSAHRADDPSFAEPTRKRIDFTTIGQRLASPPGRSSSSSSALQMPAAATSTGFGNFSISSGKARPSGGTSMPSSTKLLSKPSATSVSARSNTSTTSSNSTMDAFEKFQAQNNRFGGMSAGKVSYQQPSGWKTFSYKPSGGKPPIPSSAPAPKPSASSKNSAFSSLKKEAKAESKSGSSLAAPKPNALPPANNPIPVRKDLKRPVPPGGLVPRSRPFPSRGMGGRTLFDSSMVAEDEDWESNDALKDLIADQEQMAQEKRTVMSLGADPVRVTNKSAEREAQKAFEKAKLGTDMSYLDREVLSWNFAAIDGDRPPFSVKDLKKVPLVFQRGMQQYREVFQPLLFLECWEHLVNTKEEMGDMQDISVGMTLEAVASVDSFLEITFVAPTKDVKLVQISENDLLNCVMEPEAGTSKLPADQRVAFLGKVLNLVVRKEEMRATIRASATKLLPQFRTGSPWMIVKLMSLTTVHREFSAMQALDYFPLKEEIYRPKRTEKPKLDVAKVDQIKNMYGVNLPQAEVISTVLSNTSGFTLCQGPPGTGKTKMILSLIASLVKEHSTTRHAPEKVSLNNAKRGAHILVCAPSNAGCDEIVRRLKTGVSLPNGELLKLKVVRVGTSEAIHPENLDVFLDNLVQEQLLASSEYKELPEKGSNKKELAALQDELRQIREDLDALEQSRKTAEPDSEEMAEIKVQQRAQLEKKRALLAKQESARTGASESEAKLGMLKRELRVKILDEADAVLCTLSASGQEMFPQLSQAFQTVIIDEAAQAVELSALIPLKYGAQRAVLVGDPQQLPPTVLSRHAIDLSYEQSLFERLRNAGHYSHLLSIQYRMHPDISRFPSAFFYESRLQDGPGIAAATRREWHDSPEFRPYIFYNVAGREQTGPGHSLFNTTEAEAARALVDMLLSRYPRLNFSGRIGIISPYKKQVNEIKKKLRDRFGRDVVNYLDVNSVDGFQGQEKDVIIFSCVRAGTEKGIGFLKDLRRLNVAITRSKASLWILGDATSLSIDPTFRSLIDNARDRGCFRHFESQFSRLSALAPDNWRPRVSLPGSPTSLKPSITVLPNPKKRPSTGLADDVRPAKTAKKSDSNTDKDFIRKPKLS